MRRKMRKTEASDNLSPKHNVEAIGRPLKGVGTSKVMGAVLKWDGSISFLGDVDPEAGVLRKDGKEFDLKDKILVFTEGAGSTVGSYVIYNLWLFGKAPAAMVMSKADAIITIGCILADIPLVSGIEKEVMELISTGDMMEVDPASGVIRTVEDR
jgi:predicted aconitase with swiveling domain